MFNAFYRYTRNLPQRLKIFTMTHKITTNSQTISTNIHKTSTDWKPPQWRKKFLQTSTNSLKTSTNTQKHPQWQTKPPQRHSKPQQIHTKSLQRLKTSITTHKFTKNFNKYTQNICRVLMVTVGFSRTRAARSRKCGQRNRLLRTSWTTVSWTESWFPVIKFCGLTCCLVGARPRTGRLCSRWSIHPQSISDGGEVSCLSWQSWRSPQRLF